MEERNEIHKNRMDGMCMESINWLHKLKKNGWMKYSGNVKNAMWLFSLSNGERGVLTKLKEVRKLMEICLMAEYGMNILCILPYRKGFRI